MSISAPKLKGRPTLGVVAVIVASVGLVAGCILQFVGGMRLGGIAEYIDVALLVEEGKQIDAATLPDAAKRIVNAANTVSVIAFIVWLLLALWAIIQGIAAIVTRRGRVWGIAALVVATVGYFLVQVAYTVGLATGVAPFLG